jgi:hypothetical protein
MAPMVRIPCETLCYVLMTPVLFEAGLGVVPDQKKKKKRLRICMCLVKQNSSMVDLHVWFVALTETREC